MANNIEKYLIIIPNMIKPYGYELVQILAYPSNILYRFRFEEEWVHEKVKYNLKKMTNREGYILFRDKNKAKLYPIRRFILRTAQKIGTIYYFEYELKELFDYDSKKDLQEGQIDKFNRDFLVAHDSIIKNNESKIDMKPLVLLSNFNPDIMNNNKEYDDGIEKECEQWGNIITFIKEIKFYQNVEFIKIIDTYDVKCPDKKVNIEHNALVVTEGKDYHLRILQITKRLIEVNESPRDIALKTDNKYISLIRDRQRAVGKYDILIFMFRINPWSGNTRSFIDIIHEVETEAEQYTEPTLHIPIKIESRPRKILINIIIFLIFMSVYIFPNIVQLIFDLKERLIKDISIVIIAVTIIGFFKIIRNWKKKV